MKMRGHMIVREVTVPNSNSRTVVTDRTVLRVHHSRLQERIRVVCTTRHQHTSRFVTVSDACTTLPPFRKHVTTIRYELSSSQCTLDILRKQYTCLNYCWTYTLLDTHYYLTKTH